MTERPAGGHSSALLANPRADRVKHVASLAGRSARRRDQEILVEGPQSVRELVAHRAEHVRGLYIVEDALGSHGPLDEIADAAIDAGLFVHPMTAEVAQAMSLDCQGIVAVAGTSAVHSVLAAGAPRLVAILSQVRDPGNAGAAIRVADAAGADAIILAGESVDPTNPKVVRASAGSLFHIPVLRTQTLADAVTLVREAGLAVVAADVSGTEELGSPADGGAQEGRAAAIDLGAATAWIFGNEAWGLRVEDLELVDKVVRIPIFGKAESLNLGTAVAVCLYWSALAQKA